MKQMIKNQEKELNDKKKQTEVERKAQARMELQQKIL